jgi:signal peptidase I
MGAGVRHHRSDPGAKVTEAIETAPAEPAAEAKTVPAKKPVDWKGEFKGIFWLVLAVLGFHSFIAKPFYIPSESMLPGLLVGDRLVVTKYPYGWSFVSPSFHIMPPTKGRVLGKMPERGDIVIAAPPGVREDYIKRVMGLPGDRLEVRNGTVVINGVPVKRSEIEQRMIPVDANTRCSDIEYPGLTVQGQDGRAYCQLPVVRETLPNGRSYDTVDLGYKYDADDYGPVTIPAGHVFLMGDNRDRSADSRFSIAERGLGGPVPWENIGGRAEFITFSLDGTTNILNPLSWFTALRGGRAGTSLHPDQAE